MNKRVGLLHTSLVFIKVVPVIHDYFEVLLPDVEVIDFIDSKMLADVLADGEIKPSIISRMTHLAKAAEDAKVDVIFSTCSSLGPTIDPVREAVKTTIIKIDDAMAQVAAEKGKDIGVLATVPSTLPPTMALIQEKADGIGKEITLHPNLSKGAFDKLMAGDQAGHDQLVLDAALSIAPKVDVIALAQASMTRLGSMLSKETGLDVLTSPRLGVEYVKDFLEK